jgi:hypothetical protein
MLRWRFGWVDSLAPARLALRAAFASLPSGCPRRLGPAYTFDWLAQGAVALVL